MNRESLIWTIVVVVAGALLLGRAFLTEHGMGKAYVEERPVDRVKVVPPDAVADPETGEVERVWMDAEEAASAGIELPDEGSEDRIQWTDYAASQYRLYVEAEQQDPNQTQYQFSIARSIGLWIAAALTLFVMSFLIKDNPLYKIAESIFVGVSAAYWMVISFWNTLVPNLFAHLVPDLVKATVMPGLGDDAGFQPLYLIPLVLAIMLLWRLSPVGSWISRWPMAFFIGVFCGWRLIRFLDADFRSQIRNSIEPLVELDAGGTFLFWDSLANVVLVIGVLACIVYFFFSIEHKGIVGKTAKLGIWYLMITFGAAFGYTVMGRIALLAIRIEFLLDDWLWLIDPLKQRMIDT